MEHMSKKPKTISDQLRHAILNADVSRYRICADLDFDQGALSKFMNGRAGLGIETIDRIAEYLGLELVERKANPSKRKRR